MPKFKIEGTSNESGRPRTRIYTAWDKTLATKMAEAHGTKVNEIEELPPETPTENQLEYAKKLEINIPADATQDELSDLISCKVGDDSTASAQLLSIASDYQIETTRYTGETEVYRRIFSTLSTAGREQEMAAWFAFNVWIDRSNSQSTAKISSPNDPRLYSVSAKLVEDSKVMQSINRYSESSLLWFGERTDREGFIKQGGSNRTAAYKAAAALVDAELGLQSPAPKPSQKSSTPPTKREIKGTANKSGASIAVIAIIVIFILLVVWAMF